MGIDARIPLEVIPPGAGIALDLEGSKGMLRRSLQVRGCQYINLDIVHFSNGEPSLVSDAHRLPFKDASADLVVSKDTLEHSLEPWVEVKEAYKVLEAGARFIIWLPFSTTAAVF